MPPKKYRCTACNEKILSAFDAHLHPLLKCLVCRSCRDNYGTGDFSVFEDGVDGEGDDNYCRWCVDGGDLFGCASSKDDNKCHYSFCKDCVERNLPDDQVLHQDDLPADHDWKWSCLACDKSKLKKQRQAAQEAILALSQRDFKRNGSNNNTSGNASMLNVTSNNESVTASTTSDRRSRVIEPMDIDIISNSDEPSESAKKRRRIETNGSGDKVAETRDPPKETTRESTRESNRDSNKEPTRETRESTKETRESTRDIRDSTRETKDSTRDTKESTKDTKESTREISSKGSNRESTRDVPKESPRESSRESASTKELVREPEACLMPPLEKPRPPKTSLRNLNSDSRPQKPLRDRPSSTTSGLSTGLASLSSRVSNSLSSKSLGTPTSLPKPSTTSSSVPKPAAPASRSSTSSISSSGSKPTTAPIHKPTASATKQPETVSKSKPLVLTINDDNTTTAPVIQRTNLVTSHLKNLRPVSKQLKANNEQIVPTTKVQLSESQLKSRLANYGLVKEKCVKEIDKKFTIILEMFAAKDEETKLILKSQIEDLEAPLQEFNTMLLNLKSLYHSQK